MPLITEAAIRAFLRDLGLPQVDPSAWLNGTAPEILRSVVDVGRLRPRRVFSVGVKKDHTTPLETDTTFILSAPEPATQNLLRHFAVGFVTANVDIIEFNIAIPPTDFLIWRDDGGPFAVGNYIGTPNVPTQAFNSITRGKIQVIGAAGSLTGIGQQLTMRVISAVAAIKTVGVTFIEDVYNLEDFPGW